MKTCPGSATLPSYAAVPSAPPDILVAIPNLSHAFCSVGNSSHKSQPIEADRGLVGLSTKVASLESELSSVWPLPKNLARDVRYQFGSYPCTYNDLAKAGESVKAAVTQCHTALAALERHGHIDKSDEKMISHLLDAISNFDRQCEVWGKIVSNSKSHATFRSNVASDNGGVNPFDGVQQQLEVSRKQLLVSRVM